MEPITLGLLAAAGIGAYMWNKNKQQTVANAQASVPPVPPPGLTFDPGMTLATQATVTQEYLTDNDPINLQRLAAVLSAKGYTNSAAALLTKANAIIATGQVIVPPPAPPNVLVQPPASAPVVPTPITIGPVTVNIPQGVTTTSSGPTALSQLTDPSAPMAYSDVQHALNQLGITDANAKPLVEDGIPGPSTQSAISEFEGFHGLPQDGIPSPQLYAALRGALAAANIGL
jgi:peptidoglycan hydrolase-like protein with peptidoglycan-binding domain